MPAARKVQIERGFNVIWFVPKLAGCCSAQLNYDEPTVRGKQGQRQRRKVIAQGADFGALLSHFNTVVGTSGRLRAARGRQKGNGGVGNDSVDEGNGRVLTQ